jgi:feruloyl-CoA synthase
MTPATRNAPFRPVAFGPIDAERIDRPDGSILYRSRIPLDPFPDRLTDRLVHWAAESPGRTFVARRTPEGPWRRISYAEAYALVRRLAQSLLDRGLSAERPLIILSENSIEHLMLAMAALHAGIPHAPISPPYSLVSKDFGKLIHTVRAMTPGLVFVQDACRYADALLAVDGLGLGAEYATVDGVHPTLPCTPFAALEATSAGPEVDAAYTAVAPDTVAKVLFTSGSTSAPKGVINTHRMWCANLQQILQTMPFIEAEPPIIVDWLPWNHTFGGNHNVGLTLFAGGTLYLDDGKPTPRGMETTVANLREIAPTMYFSVPRGFEELLPWLWREPGLAKTFFSRLNMLFYAGASLAQPIRDGLDKIAVATCRERIPIITGLGMTEAGPSACFAHWPEGYSGLIGVPVPGLEMRLVPAEGKLEARYRGPNITPGYWRAPEITAASFDTEGYFRTGDAVRFVDPGDPNRGLEFDGRIVEDFKLTTGTWVNVGILRAEFLKRAQPLVQDVVIAGHDRDEVGAILFLNLSACRELAGLPEDTPPAAATGHGAVTAALQSLLDAAAAEATGSANRITRAIVAVEPPSIDLGEITDKGSLNQRLILLHRTHLVEALYASPPPASVVGLTSIQSP